MNKILLLTALSLISLYGSNNIWSKDTEALSQDKSKKILKDFENRDSSSIEFENDPKYIKNLYDFKENIFVLGLSVGASSYSEELSNTTGSLNSSYSSYNTKFMLAKDFTLWHEEYTQLSRVYFTYALTTLESDVDFSTWSLGLRENMKYYSLYKTDTYRLYPTISFEFGKSSMNRESLSISGFTTEINLGLTYSRDDNFEYFLNFCSNTIYWDHPVDGIADKMSGYGLHLGLNYKLNYGDF